MLKRILAGALLAILVACGTVPTSTPNDQAAIALRSITAARQVSTAALSSGKISLAADQANQAKLDTLRAATEAALAAGNAAAITSAKTSADAIAANPGATK